MCPHHLCLCESRCANSHVLCVCCTQDCQQAVTQAVQQLETVASASAADGVGSSKAVPAGQLSSTFQELSRLRTRLEAVLSRSVPDESPAALLASAASAQLQEDDCAVSAWGSSGTTSPLSHLEGGAALQASLQRCHDALTLAEKSPRFTVSHVANHHDDTLHEVDHSI